MQHLILVSVLIAILGLAFTITGFKRLIQRRYIPAAGLEISALLLLVIAASVFLLASNLYTYKRLNYEQAVAEAGRCMSCGMCFECDNCVIYCPQDAIFRVKKDQYTTGRYVDTDYNKCIGCHICSDVCPTGYIDMAMGDH